MIKISRQKKKFIAVVVGLILLIATAGVAYAAFANTGKVLGSSFKVGSVDLKFLYDVTAGAQPSNLVEELNGISFDNIGQNWQGEYLIKLYNDGTNDVYVTSNAEYATANDPADLRQVIFVEIFGWNDVDDDGILDEDELGGSFGKKTIVKWKTEGIPLGNLIAKDQMPLVIRFYTENLSETKQGAQGVFDFIFDAAEI